MGTGSQPTGAGSQSMGPVIRTIAWTATALVLMALAIPWFLWGDDRVLYGVPLWIWWHVCWLAVAAVVFWHFANTAWGLGIAGGER